MESIGQRLSPLEAADIEEKIKLNAGQGIDLKTLRERLGRELKTRKWELIKNQINIQSISEQIEYIDSKITVTITKVPKKKNA